MTLSTIKLAEKILGKNDSTYCKVTMMAFLFQGSTLLNYGINSNKTHPTQHKWRIKANIHLDLPDYLDKLHAEVSCLKPYINDKEFNFKKSTLLILSKRMDGSYRDSKPCPVCMKMIKDMGIGNVYYYYNGNLIHEKIKK